MGIIPGLAVTIRHYTKGHLYNGIVVNILGDNILVKPQKEFAIFSYFTNDPVVIGYESNNKMQLYECCISKIDYANEVADLKIKESYILDNLRQNDRYPTSLYGVLIHPKYKGSIYIGNLSHEGMCIKTKTDIDLRDKLGIETYIDGVLLNVKLEVAWKKIVEEDFEYGLQIEEKQENTQKIIGNYIENIRKSQYDAIKLLKNEWLSYSVAF